MKQARQTPMTHSFGCALLTSVLAVFTAITAEAKWTYESEAKTLSDGNWTFNVGVGTYGGKTGFCINSASYKQADTTNNDVDFTACADEAGYPLLSVTVKLNSLPVRKFIAPDLVDLNSFSGNTTLEEITVSSDIYYVNEACFSGCLALKKLEPTHLPKLPFKKSIFYNCQKLEGDFEFDAWKKVDQDAPMQYCHKVTSLKLPNLTRCEKNMEFWQMYALTNFYAPKLVYMNSATLRDCTSLRTVVVSDAITTIGDYAFAWCSHLESLYPMSFTNLTTLGAAAFDGCSSLSGELSFPKITVIQGSCFKDASKLESVVAPKAIIGGGNYIFDACASLTNVVIGGFDDVRQYTFGDKTQCNKLEHIWVTGAFSAPSTSHKDRIFSQGWNGNASTRPPILHIKEASHVYSAWEANCAEVKANLSDNAKKVANYADGTVDPDALIGFLGSSFTINKDGTIKSYYQYKGDLCWFVRWDDAAYMSVTCAVPDHVAVQEVKCNDVHVNAYGGKYEVPTSGKLTITYVVIDGMTFEDGSTECTVSNITPQETIPAETCNKTVVAAVPRTVSVDLTALNAEHIAQAVLSCEVDFTCVTNESNVIVWTVASGIPFTLTYTSEEGYYFGESRTKSVSYEEGITADTKVDVEKLTKPTVAEDKWKEVTDDSQHYLQNLGLGWKFYISSSKKSINGITGFEIFRDWNLSVTAVAMARGDGVLDLTNVEKDTGYPVVSVNYGAFNNTNGKNTWTLTKFIAPKCQSIGTCAFEKQKQLGEVLISGTASTLFSERAFNGCTSLTNFTPTVFPNVTSIGANAFYQVPVGGDWVLAGVTRTERTIFQNNTNPNGFSVSMPNLTTVAGGNAAYLFGNSTITNFSGPKLTTLNSGLAFYACSRLTDVTLPDSIKEMGGSTFAYCSALTNLYPRAFTNLTTMGGSEFESCTSLTGELSFPKMKSFKACVFEKASKLTSVVAPNAIVGDGNYLFNGCASLTNVVIGGLNGLRQYTFSGCSILEHIWITGVGSAPATNHVLGCFSQGWNGNASTRPPILHIREKSRDYSGWEKLCNQTKANLKPATKLIANYADSTVSHSKLIGYIGDDVVLKKDGTIDHYYCSNWDLCWFVKWETDRFTIILK